MLEIKFLCDNIIVNIQNEEHIHSDKITSIIFSILGEFEELYSIDDVAMNSGIYSHINPEDNLIILNCRGIVENETFYINLYKQTYKIEGNNLDTLEVTINSEEKNSKLYEFKISIKNILK